MNKIETTVTSVSIHLEGESPIHGMTNLKISLDDDGAGPFLVIEDSEDGIIKMNIEEVPAVVEAIRMLVNQDCMEDADKETMSKVTVSKPNTKKEKS